MLVDTAQLWIVSFSSYGWQHDHGSDSCVVYAPTANEAVTICAAQAKRRNETIWSLNAEPLEILMKE